MTEREFISYARFTKRIHYFESPEQSEAIGDYATERKLSKGAAIRALIAKGLRKSKDKGE